MKSASGVYLSARQFKTMTALAEVLIAGELEQLSPDEIAHNIDTCLQQFRAQRKYIVKLALVAMEYFPLLYARLPLSMMKAEPRRDFIKLRFYEDARGSRLPASFRNLVQGAIRLSQQLTYLGYYGDPRTHASVGYVPFEQRAANDNHHVAQPHRPLAVCRPQQIQSKHISGDVIVIGSGAAASIVADELTRRGRSVVMLERGRHVSRAEMSFNEAEMFAKLYDEGAIQLSRDFHLQILQGSCVGGSTVVNNAVCFDPPPEILHSWNGPDLQCGLDLNLFEQSRAFVSARVEVKNQAEHANPGVVVLQTGTERLGMSPPLQIDANIRSCQGCGYCNFGCRFGAKLSMLEHVLPDAQARNRAALSVYSECEVLKLHASRGQIRSASCRLSDGRLVRVTGRTFVIAAGAISSSVLLQRSGLDCPNAGKHLSFNIGSPLTAAYDKRIEAFRGLQISHYLKRKNSQSVLESWWNPPAAQALTMPGWFEDHYSNMKRYANMCGLVALVATDASATVRNYPLLGRVIDYTPSDADLRKLGAALSEAATIMLASGALAVMPATFEYCELKKDADVAELPTMLAKPGNLFLGTSHPQGGNRMSKDSSQAVVDPELRVPGYHNLHVCDASVFPTSVGVNPQLTVMAMAHYATRFMAA